MPAPDGTLAQLRAAHGLYSPLDARFVRVCIRCEQKMLGYSYFTFYGVFTKPDGTRVPVCGEPCHMICPPPGRGSREIYRDEPTLGRGHRPTRKVAPGIDQILGTDRYAVRVLKKRLGTYATYELAEHARDEYLRTAEKRHSKKLARRRERYAETK